jgi:hypothetical protein
MEEADNLFGAIEELSSQPKFPMQMYMWIFGSVPIPKPATES